MALAASAFAMGTAEFVVAGLLPTIAADLEVSISVTGLLISAYALAIVVGGPLFTAAGLRAPRRRLLVLAAALFVAGNVMAAIAPGYPVLMAGRMLAAFGQGSFLPIASVVAADLVPAHLRARAIAVVFAGGTAANVAGTPLGTLLGQQFGWRSTFWTLAAIGIASLIAVAVAVPSTPRPVNASLRGESAVFGRLRIWLTLAIGMLGFGGLFSSFTYIAPFLTSVSGYPAGAVAPLLALFGVGLVVGNLAGGRFGGRNQLGALAGALALLTVGLSGLALGGSSPVLAVILLILVGAAGFALVAPFMTRLIDQAGGAPLLAAAAGGSAANLGAAAGAYLGGLAIDFGLGFTGPPAIGSAIAATGLLVLLTARALDRTCGRRGRLRPADRP
ncbi:MFS transporter [Nonomuraea jabiensis]|uniref:MFS transporter n=1 Tax=Nonomuraea jabiensis TaxID=882448 RepID=UPI0036CBA61A